MKTQEKILKPKEIKTHLKSHDETFLAAKPTSTARPPTPLNVKLASSRPNR